jgi:hypothetical protein
MPVRGAGRPLPGAAGRWQVRAHRSPTSAGAPPTAAPAPPCHPSPAPSPPPLPFRGSSRAPAAARRAPRPAPPTRCCRACPQTPCSAAAPRSGGGKERRVPCDAAFFRASAACSSSRGRAPLPAAVPAAAAAAHLRPPARLQHELLRVLDPRDVGLVGLGRDLDLASVKIMGRAAAAAAAAAAHGAQLLRLERRARLVPGGPPAPAAARGCCFRSLLPRTRCAPAPRPLQRHLSKLVVALVVQHVGKHLLHRVDAALEHRGRCGASRGAGRAARLSSVARPAAPRCGATPLHPERPA